MKSLDIFFGFIPLSGHSLKIKIWEIFPFISKKTWYQNLNLFLFSFLMYLNFRERNYVWMIGVNKCQFCFPNTSGEALLRLPVFAEAVRKCDVALKPKGVDIYKILIDKDQSMFDNVLNSFVGIAAVQVKISFLSV